MGDVVSTKVAAGILGVTPQRVRQLKADLGGYHLDGRTLVFPRAKVAALAAAWKRDGRPRPGRKAKPAKADSPARGRRA